MGEFHAVKRRAIAARLLTFLLPMFALVGGASAMAAEPPSPRLATTDPVSSAAAPAASLTPAVLGEAEPEDGIIKESVPIGAWPLRLPVTSTVEKPTEHPGFEIQIFDGGDCSGLPVGVGTAEELEEVGIPVTVAADVKTTLSAVQIDPGDSTHPSPCSVPLYYWEGNVPVEEGAPGEGSGPIGGGGGPADGGSSEGGGSGPGQSVGGSSSSGDVSSGGSISKGTPAGGKPEAPHIHMSPAEVSNDSTPLVVGSAPGADSVSLYANGNCSGTPVARAAASQLPSGVEVSVPENAVTTFSALAIGAQPSSCSSSVTYTEDSTAPRTRITMGPGVKTRKHKAVFRFQDISEDPPGTTFRCKVNRRKWRPCSSPFRLKHLKARRYVLKIRATDLAGNVQRRPVKRRFIVVSRARS